MSKPEINWVKTKSFAYVVRASESVDGITMEQLRTYYFSVGVGTNSLTDLPFTDLLVVFSLLGQMAKKMEKITVTTKWPDEEAAQLLSEIRIQDATGKDLRFVEERHSPAPEDDPQT